jgi:hypothetical protein
MNMTKDQIDALIYSFREIAWAIRADALGNHDEEGGYVTSLTEAMMGQTKALSRIAIALEAFAGFNDEAS